MVSRNETRIDMGSIDFFVSLLFRYPEIASIKYEPVKNKLKIAFLVSEIVTSNDLRVFQDTLHKSLNVFYQLQNKTVYHCTVSHTHYEHISLVEINRDLQSLCSKEIHLIVSLFKQQYLDILLIDQAEVEEEEMHYQDEMIENTLESLKQTQTQSKKNLIALREEGRVLVFNK